MAQSEEDREDLMQEATALVRRGEYAAPQEVEVVTIGYRQNGALSIFFGQDPVYQFNDAGQFRRGYIDGELFKADGGRLVCMRRQRDGKKTTLVSTSLSDVDQAEVIVKMEWRLNELAESIEEQETTCNEVIPDDANVAGEFLEWWRQKQMNIDIAPAPNVVAPKA
ncbi:hypothetical protein LOC68_05000 [Blastopirellula sp. JC732]|uniref:Uncharacterized protein n=1 Tax=Blastopirellula sediminis TaxID=2894196 RepID=A0A9X1MID9_9BACT|nr:hypothetical protein [Blastopirellula sediminis]MCC9609480.1 hypothetical protein [Blastopirellula sediminis]MCC9627743.1 hypothetical protein [Blastopirellula sediminis]